MNIQYAFTKDDVLHIISNDSTIVALDGELRSRWGNWSLELSSLLDNDQLKECSSKRITSIVYLRSSFEFVFLFDDCRLLVVTDVEYNIKQKHTIHTDKDVVVQSMKFIPYSEHVLILLANRVSKSNSKLYESFIFMYDLDNPNPAVAETVIEGKFDERSTPLISFDII